LALPYHRFVSPVLTIQATSLLRRHPEDQVDFRKKVAMLLGRPFPETEEL
jgi:hypothetical protein